MNPIKRLTPGLGLATLTFLTQISLVVAHAGEAHPHHAEATPWPIAGPVIALLVSGAAFWLTNRDDAHFPPARQISDQIDPTDADLNQPGARSDSSGGLLATGHPPRNRTQLVALRSSKPPSLSVATPQPPRSAPRTLEETWITHDLTR